MVFVTSLGGQRLQTGLSQRHRRRQLWVESCLDSPQPPVRVHRDERTSPVSSGWPV